METHAAFIDALGGGTKVAELLSKQTGQTIDRERVYKWKSLGIPPKWRPDMAKLALAGDVSTPDDFFQPMAAPPEPAPTPGPIPEQEDAA